MATIDSLDIQISGSVQKANQAIDSLITNLGRLANSLKIDTSGLEKIGKSLNFSGIDKAAKNMQSQTQKASKSLSQITEQYKDLGKGFEIKGSTQQIQKQIDSLTNKLANAKLAKEDFEASGKTNLGGYETAVKNVIKYTNQIESLKNQLAGLQNAQPKLDFNTTGIEEAGKKVSEVTEKIKTATIPQSAFNYNADAMRAVFGEVAAGIENWSQATQKFGANAGAVLNQTASKTEELKARTEQFEQSLKNLQIPPINTDNINVLQRELAKSEANFEKLKAKLANGIAVGRISADVDDKGYRNLREQMALAEKTAESLREKIKQVQDASNQTSTGAKKLGDSVNSASKSFSVLASSSTKEIKPLNNLGNSFKSLLRTILPILGIRQLFNWGKQAMEISSDLTEVQNVVDTTFGDMAYKVEEFAETSIEKFGMSELALKQISSRFQAMGTAMGFPIDRMSDMSVELTKLTADMASFYNVEQKAVAEDLAAIFTGQTRPLRDYGLDLTQATLQEWALKQGMDANIQSMSQAEKTMLRYQYVMANTGAAQGDFARTADTWANQIRILKQNFEQLGGVIGGALINAIKPFIQMLNTAMQYVIAFAQTVSNALGKIFGWTYEGGSGGFVNDMSDAAGSAEDVAGGMSDAEKSAKKLKTHLLSIDELNVVEPDSGSSGGAGGGVGSGISGLDTDEIDGGWEKAETIFDSNIRSLYQLGKKIGDTLTDMLKKIDWDNVYESARGFGKGLADFLNGLISPELFSEIGTTVGGALNTAFHFLDSFGYWFNWANFGNSLGAGLNAFMSTIQWDVALSAAKNWGEGIATALNNFLYETDFSLVGSTVANALNVAIQFALSLGTKIDFEAFGRSIAEAVNGFFLTFNFSDLAEAINVWVKGILGSITTFVNETDWGMIGEKIGNFIADIDLLEVGTKIAKLLWKAINAAVETWGNMFKAAPIETAIITALGTAKLWKSLTKTKVAKWLSGITGGFRELANVLPVASSALGGNTTAIETLSASFPGLGNAVRIASDSFLALKMGVADGQFLTGANLAIENVRNNLSGLQKGAITAAAAFAEFSVVSNVFEGLTLGTENVVSGIGKIASAVAAAGAAMYVALGPAGLAIAAIVGAAGAVKGIKDAFDEIHAENVGNAIKTALENPGGVSMDELASSFTGKMSEIADSFDGISIHSQELDKAQQNITDTSAKIDAIKIAMDNGTLSVEDGVRKLNEAFANMSASCGESIDLLEEDLILALGEGGILRQTLQAMGYDVDHFTGTIMETTDAARKKIEELEQEYSSLKDNTDPESMLRKEEILTQLSELSGGFDDTTEAIDEFAKEMSNTHLNLSEIIDTENLTYDEAAISSFLDELTDAYKTTQGTVSEKVEGIMNDTEKLAGIAETLGMDENSTEFKELMNGFTKILEETDGDLKAAITGVTNTLQQDLIGGIDTVIEQAKEEWGGMSPLDKMLSGFSSEGDFVEDYVAQYQTNVIEPMSSEIETALSNVGIEGAGWAGEASKKIIDGLFDEGLVLDPVKGLTVASKLSAGWKTIIEEAQESIQIGIDNSEFGKNITEGLANGMDDPAAVNGLLNTADSVMNKLDEHIHDGVWTFGSPSAHAKDYGMWVVQGFNNGITENTQSSIDAITTWATSVSNAMKSALGIGGTEDTADPSTSMFGGMISNFTSTWTSFSETWTEKMESWKASNEQLYFGETVWDTNWMNIYNTYIKVWAQFEKQWKANFDKWWKVQIVPYFSVKQWTEFGTNMKNGIYGGFRGVVNSVGGILNSMISMFDSAFGKLEKAMNKLISDYNKAAKEMGTSTISKVSYEKMGKISVPAYAAGGFPEDGLFYANHTELVGEFTNGRTAVANNEQIVEGIKRGVREAVAEAIAPYLSDIAKSNREIAEKEMSVNIGDDEIFEANRRGSQRWGWQF